MGETNSPPKTRPNVLLILTDDQGWDDLGLHGNPLIETPRLDSLGRESARFANYYVAPVCAPTRASLLTGRHFLRTGVSHVHGGKDFVHPGEVLLGQLFQRAGYRTGMWGKWHSGKTSGYFPWERGFDEAYMARLYRHRDSDGEFNGSPRRHTGWTVDTLTDYALDFITRHRAGPWFAFLPYLTVHAPLDAPEERIARCEARGMGRTLASIYAMIEQLDDNIGRLLDHLRRLGLDESTVVVFMSDNGPQYFGDRMDGHDLALRYVSGYKGHKGSMWENGIKSPLFVRYPRRFAPRAITRLCDVCDVFPTLLDLCGIDLPAGHPPLDGRSIVPWLAGDESALPPKVSVIASNPGWPPQKSPAEQRHADRVEYRPIAPEEKTALDAGQQLLGLRTESCKLLQNEGYAPGAPPAMDGRVLIDIANDPREDRNVVAERPDTAREMSDALRAWFETVKADPHSYHAPVFALGPGTSSEVLLYAPRRIRGGIVNQTLASGGWTAAGDGADFGVDVRTAGRYTVSLECRAWPGGEASMRLRIGDAVLGVTIGKGGRVPLGDVELAAGPAEASLDTVAASSAEGPASLVSIRFDPTFAAAANGRP